MIISPWQKSAKQSRSSLSLSLCCISFHKVPKFRAKEMFIRVLACLSLWYHACPTKAKLWLAAASNANSCKGSFACCYSTSRACTPRHGPAAPPGTLVCITTSWQRKNIHPAEPPPTQVHMCTTCFPASPFEDSTGSICKCFLSILEEAVESRILESNCKLCQNLSLLLT